MSNSYAATTNEGPDGETYPFGRIIATDTIGPYCITTVISQDGTQHFSVYVDRHTLLAEARSYAKREGKTRWQRTSQSFTDLDEALAFAIGFRHQGPNVSNHVAHHFIKGLRP